MPLFWLTSKMSRDHSWRGLCVSTERDSYGRWLWRLVRLLFFIELDVSRDIAAKSPRYKTGAETNQKNAEQ